MVYVIFPIITVGCYNREACGANNWAALREKVPNGLSRCHTKLWYDTVLSKIPSVFNKIIYFFVLVWQWHKGPFSVTPPIYGLILLVKQGGGPQGSCCTWYNFIMPCYGCIVWVCYIVMVGSCTRFWLYYIYTTSSTCTCIKLILQIYQQLESVFIDRPQSICLSVCGFVCLCSPSWTVWPSTSAAKLEA